MNVTIEIPDWARQMMSDLTDMERNPQPVDSAKVRRFTLELPDDVYFEYAFVDEHGRIRPDPKNETRAENPWYPGASAIYGPAYRADPYFATPLERATGRVKRERLESRVLGRTRRLTLYTPAGHEDASLPVIYVQDGTAYFRIARLAAVLEALLAAGEVRPAHLVFIEPVDRSVEYRYNPEYRAFVVEEVLPFAEAQLAASGERIAMGASLGGLMSATLAVHHPELFGTVLAQSGAFLGSPEELDFYRGKSSWLESQLTAGAAREVRWWLQVGTLEWLLEVNRRVEAALEAGGYDYAYTERNAGHNWVNWRNGLASALRFALPRSA